MNRRSLLSLFLTALTLPAVAQQDAPPPDTGSMLRSLQEFREKNTAMSQSYFVSILRDLQSASASDSAAIDFYEKAVQATEFIGRSQQGHLFQEWKKKEAAKLKSPERQNAVRLHLKYLTITLKKALGTPVEQLVPELIAYGAEVQKVEADPELRLLIAREDLWRKPVTDGMFANWLRLAPLISGDKEWEPVPSKVDGIYQKTILPVLRKAKDPGLLRYWDTRMALEEKIAADSRLTFEIEKYQYVTKPSLLWARAQEVIVLGQRNHAINEMFALIKKYPDHPDNAAWIAHLESVLKPRPKE
ncbi:MAG TPA: hypothetical protein VNQ90_11125 [Chthoniobacteraceae bacterium]|nr:hypothetical protein [Chthoniobacteraceae bacterium]